MNLTDKQVHLLCKEYNLNIPLYHLYDYYIEQMFKSKEFEWLKEAIEDVKDYTSKFTDTSAHRDEALVKFKNFMNEYDFKEKLNSYQFNNDFKKKEFKPLENQEYLSIDFSESNWNITQKVLEFKDTVPWLTFMRELDIHDFLGKSKKLRQYFLGQFNPARIVKIQESITQKLVDTLESENFIIEGVYSDEIIINASNLNFGTLLNLKDKLFFSEYNVKIKHFKITKIPPGYIYDYGNYTTLKHCRGDRFYINFKKYILKEPVFDTDCFFNVDGHKAMWIE